MEADQGAKQKSYLLGLHKQALRGDPNALKSLSNIAMGGNTLARALSDQLDDLEIGWKAITGLQEPEAKQDRGGLLKRLANFVNDFRIPG